MQIAVSRLAQLRPSLPRWQPTLLLRNWLVGWVLLPNLAFCLLWIVAAPPRTGEIIAVAVVGLIVRRARYAIQLTAFAAVMAYSILSYIAATFNLAVSNVAASVRFFAELDPLRSPTYLAALLGMLALLAGAARWLRADSRFERGGDLVIAVAAIAGMTAIDFAASAGSRGSYKRLPSADAPFASATDMSGIARGADGSRHLLIVVMEAMGSPVDPVLAGKMFGRWNQPDVAARYAVRVGRTPFYGSTTNGELRELCGRWDDYAGVLARRDVGCLPARLRAKGYQTMAVHGFAGRFFDRSDWYPNIGFDRQVFGEQLLATGSTECPGVFPGACDAEIPARIGKRLKAADKPQFVYWLTLNAHLPVPASATLGTEDCVARHPDLPVRSGGLCRLVTVTQTTSDRLAAMLLDPALPPTDVLIVGDHMPPFFDHVSRAQFDPYNVPWILLKAR